MQRISCVAAVTAAIILSAACKDHREFRLPAAPTPTPATPTVPPPPPGPDLSGSYALTIQADSACVDLPEIARKRMYVATLEKTPYAYLGISIVGGGFTERTVTGDLWNSGAINWNNFDIGGCDGYMEPLGQSQSMMICGTGMVQATESSITSAVNGKIFVEENVNGTTRRTSECVGTHRFTFQRTAS